MSNSPIATATVQATLLSVVSNLLAQSIRSYQESKPLALDLAPLVRFAIWTIISTPPNFLWQELLESWFPSKVPVKKETVDEKKGTKTTEHTTALSTANTIKKFATDQLIGGPVNTVLFLAAMGYFKGVGSAELVDYVKKEYWPLTIAGLKLWPAVSLLSFSVVPAQSRIVFMSVVALGWNIFLGLTMS